ncbi:hypothetical protein AGABI1DRAFT_104272 [Agaricus bisporus var. burnettii JB137-S8]|uniref:Uncharacterized protein n=1 Tax=Agaricus bisporus var. burnettii (strain JB137-S8 / ATCC MYA-4627 / FGSC 10392) TaxID=597362 RepID=K5WBU3_AGABU|nr:uncharacterized protein AGABI1DRAFT_104272 [Agaricus bisporus var. burnettii JB137-S8]EKM84374.1 hypothetical protein AGABI1DRAFT_104272 [Agaricus bisporus var. burnettii JB137-S8]
MSPERSQQNLTRLGLLSLSVTGTLLNMRLKSIIDPYYSQSQAISGEALLRVLTSEEYSNVDTRDHHRLLQCFCLSISSLTHGFPSDSKIVKFIYATAAVFSDPEQEEAVLGAMLQVITAGYKKLQSELAVAPLSTEQELHGALFRQIYVTVKRLERILTQHNEMRSEGHAQDMTLRLQQTKMYAVAA